MIAERELWFPELEPPPGGSERLSQRLTAADRPAAIRQWWIGAACTAIALAIAIVALLRDGEDADIEATMNLRQAESLNRLLGRPIERKETRMTIDDETVQVSRLDGSNPKIHLYRID